MVPDIRLVGNIRFVSYARIATGVQTFGADLFGATDYPYDSAQLNKIAEHLGVPVQDIATPLQNAAQKYLGEISLASDRELQAKALKAAAKHARKLNEALSDPQLYFPNLGETNGIAPKILEEFKASALADAKAVTQGNRTVKEAKLDFIRELTDIYEVATGKPPRRTYDPIRARESGRVLEFVKLSFEGLPGRVSKLAWSVRKVCKARNSIGSSS